MQRDYIDFHAVPDHQLVIHERLMNWSRYVRTKFYPWQALIWKLGKSNGRQWHEPEIREQTDTLDGHAMEKAVSALPEKHREAIRWSYVWRTHPGHARKMLGVTNETLRQLIVDGRTILINRTIK